jgi:hypothetical protein
MTTLHITHGLNYNSPTDETIDVTLITLYGEPFATGRPLDGPQDVGYEQEWAHPCTLRDGRGGYAMFLFDDSDLTYKGEPIELEYYPWDIDHVHRIKLVERAKLG